MESFFFSSTFAETFLMPSFLSMESSCFFANTSMAKALLTSVAVVITGTAPNNSASKSAISLAPPTCPDKRGMT